MDNIFKKVHLIPFFINFHNPELNSTYGLRLVNFINLV